MTRSSRRRRAAPVLFAAAFLALAPAALPAQSRAPRVVASTSWTAALAAAAGAVDVATLAPAGLRHPAEYELKPSDVTRVAGADLVVYTGFEVMAARLVEAAGSAKVRLLKVGADYSLPTMRATLTAIGDALGTAASARAGIAALEAFLADWRAELAAAGLDGAPVVVHAFQQPLAAELGFTAKGVFGPAPLEAAQIAKLSATGARLVIDNWHNETAGPLKETMKAARFASLLNFPGPSGTVSLLGVLAENRARLKAAAGY